MTLPMFAMLGALGVGGVIFSIIAGLSQSLGARRAETEGRLDVIAGSGADDRSGGRLAGQIETGQPAPVRPRSSILDRRISRAPIVLALQRELRRAGLNWRASDYVAVMVMMAVAGGAVGWIATSSAVGALVLAPLTGVLPMFLVRHFGASRARTLNAQVSELLDLIAPSMRAGFAFTQSLELAAREQPDPLGGTIRQALREIGLGVSTDEALERMVARAADEDLELVITAVLIQRRVGGNLATVLDNIGSMVRDRARVRGEIQTLTAQARLSAKVVGFLPVGLAGAIFAMQPTYMLPLIDEPIGRLMLAAAVVLEAVGFFLVSRIGAIEY